ncbi:MAG: 7-cyano-7-deazaguanine synthase QueC [Candidatus Delongbacteria bacterium]|nr:MAG: 7-cyano-7-deazaguanine synthase QueC [Candidatus Delongbacteria bacterium]
MKEKAIVLLSGGLDSTTCLSIALNEGYEVYTLSFDYGQKHNYELDLAKLNSKNMGAVKHIVCKLDPAFFRNSALTNPSLEVPKNNDSDEIPITYVPARNTVFLSYALALAESINCFNIYIGVNSLDYSGYPDCRPEFIESFEKMANLGTAFGEKQNRKVNIKVPLISLTKGEIINIGKSLDVDYSKTITCYDPIDNKACGKCDSCKLRIKGFKESNYDDETIYFENQ